MRAGLAALCVSAVSVPAFAQDAREAKPEFKVVHVLANNYLNVRTGPSTNYAVIAGLAANSAGVTMTGDCRGYWCPIQQDAKKGWVFRAYLAAVTPAAPAPAVATKPVAVVPPTKPAVAVAPVPAPAPAPAPVAVAPVPAPKPATPPAKAETAKSLPEIAFEYFIEKGWTAHQAAGIVGNLQTECGPNFHCSIQSGGIAQWRAERVTRFRNVFGYSFHKASFKDQLDYIQWELTHPASPWKDSGRILKGARDEVSAATLFDVHYERSAGTSRGHRIANARTILKRFGHKAAS